MSTGRQSFRKSYWKHGPKEPGFLSSSLTHGQCLKVCLFVPTVFSLYLSTIGKRLLFVLAAASIPCTYLFLPALSAVISEVSIVLVGAHSIHSNGAVFSRAGTALVAMMAKQHSVPVVVCCETYKFSEGVPLDSFTKNELGD